MKCPKCKTGTVIDDTQRFGMRANKCVECGLYHEIGSNRMSIDRQVTGFDPTGRNLG